MNKKQAAEQISILLQNAFNRDTYTHFLRNLLNDVEARDNHYSGNTVPDAFKQHVNQYWRIGKYTDPEQIEMDLYVVEVKFLSKLDRARTALRNFAVRTMKTFGDKDHALVAFYAKEDNGADWRFSYVKIEHSAKLDKKRGKVKLEKELTPAKRYSYLVGEHETSHTAQAQLVDLLAMDYANPTIDEIEKAFSIEKVTKEFFEQYKDLFVRLSEVLAEQDYFKQETDPEKRKQIVAKFAKKLLGQIVFLYFLQKKGWLGVKNGDDWGKGERRFLQKLFTDAKDAGQNYYVEKLQFLFYEALANDRKDQFDPSYYKRFDCRIPFLNGGLFEANYDWQKIRVEIPNTVFSNDGKNRAGDSGTGILDVFDRYNFTIKEDEPLEKEVAVDPEMLGKVFENMLEITERKSKGAFYTPREIVHYMCQESLIHYLNQECSSSVPLEKNSNQECSSSVPLENPNDKRDACTTLVPFDFGNPLAISERNLPHWQQNGTSYFITFRLADSIPADVANRIKQERELWLEQHTEPYSDDDWKEYNRLFAERINQLLDAGSGECILKDEAVSDIVKNALLHFDGERYKLGEWVIMPNHVHLIVTPLDGYPLDKITHSWKSFSAHEINKQLNRSGAIWQHESYDHIIRNERQLRFIQRYILENPQKANLKTGYQCSSECSSTVPVENKNHKRDACATISKADIETLVHKECSSTVPVEINHKRDACATIPKADIETLVRKGIFAIENDQRILDKGKETDAYTFKLPEPIRTHAALIDDKLADIKICDPAIGSGAFPVGMLHEILHARQALAPHLPEAKRLRPYELKKHTIAHSIYGVDLDPSAIDIARLRLWLSLVVDEDDYTSIDALPNLDYKIMQGNSLIEEYEGVKLFDEAFIQEEDNSLEREKAALKEKQATAQTNFFAARNAGNAELEAQYEAKLNDLLRQIKKVESKEKKVAKEKAAQSAGLFDLMSEARNKANQLEDLHQRFFNVSSPAEKRKLRDEITNIEWELIEATLAEQNKSDALAKLAEYKNSGEKPWFLWKLNFSEVFKQKGGFDIVIGNPPYVQIQTFSGQQIQKDMEAQNYETFAKTGDIYCLFYERGYRILHDCAALCFITSNKWMRAKYGEKTRKFFAEKTAIRQLIDFGDSPIFSEATTYTNIMLFEKCTPNKCSSSVPLEKNDNRDGCATLRVWDLTNCYQKQTSLLSMLEQQGEGYASFDPNSYVIVNPKMARIKTRIEEVGTPLKDWDVSIYRGILTGFNKAFIIDDKKKAELIAADPKSAEIIKPILRGRDIKRYRADFADLWLINSHNGYGDVPPIEINDYPAIKEHLDQHWAKLEKRQDKGKTPYNLRNCAYLPEFEKEKIVWLEMSPQPNFTYLVEEMYVLNTSYIMTGKRLYSLLAVINSSVMDFYFPMIATDVRGKTRRYIKQYVERLPLSAGFEDNVANALTTYIRVLKASETLALQCCYFEQLIDGLVYELYFPEEIKAAGKEILPHLGELTPLTEDMSEEEKLAVIQREFERLYDPNHPVRNHLETLDSVEEVRIIRDALKK